MQGGRGLVDKRKKVSNQNSVNKKSNQGYIFSEKFNT